ncbi:MAG: response regulator transcription factor [Eubacterium sp.]|nr:response regulator transcription factor [Eubacterium sp.]
MALIYIVEDDKNIQEIENYILTGNGYDVCVFDDAKSFDDAMQSVLPDLILLDIMLPGEDGLSVLKRLRSKKETRDIPIIMVTAKSSEFDTVKGLDQGADDYLAKPFGVMELVSRVKAVLRRFKPMNDSVILQYNDITLNQEKRTCVVKGETVNLTYKEYELLRLFLSNVGIVLTRDMIMESVWKADFIGESRTVDMHVKTLRKKLGEAGNLIVTIRNVGYKLE